MYYICSNLTRLIMILISDNFSDSKTLLKEEAKRRDNQQLAIDEVLENETWLMFYKIGFQKLNINRQCEVKYGRENSLLSKNVDIVAESNEIRVYVECTTQKDDSLKIKQWSSEVEEIRKFENANDDTRNKNVVFVYCNNNTISAIDRNVLEKKGIVYLNTAIIDYFLELKSQYSKLAYFQLISYLCKKQEIKSISSEALKIPAIRTKYGKNTFAYLFGVHPATLIPLSTVPHRKLDFDDNLNHNYQRLIKKNKVSAIKKFIENERGIFPTNIIISIESRDFKFDPFGKAINEIQHGTLILPKKYHSINVIDGQHRLFAYDGLEQAKKDLIYVVAFEFMELEDQIKTFIDINEKQTKVSPSLLWDLYPSILSKNDTKYRISILVKNLNEEKASPFYGVIKYDSAPYSDSEPKFSLESICTAIKSEKIVETVDHIMGLLQIPNTNDSITQTVLELWFNTIKKLGLDHWNRKDQTLNLLRSNQGFGALLKIFSEVIQELYKKDKLISFNKNNLEPISNEFKGYANPIILAVNSLTSKDEIKKWKRIGEGGKQQLFHDFIREIRKFKPEFCEQIVNNLDSDEVSGILIDLESNSEHTNLEIKEAFWADTKKLKRENKLDQNPDEAIKGIIKTIVAFRNYIGGRLVIGIEDGTWDIKGVDSTDLILKKDWDTLKQSISQKISSATEGLSPGPEIRKVVHKGKTIVIIEVKPLNDDSLKNSNLASVDGDCYKRENGDSVKIKGSHIGSYCKQVLAERQENRELEENES